MSYIRGLLTATAVGRSLISILVLAVLTSAGFPQAAPNDSDSVRVNVTLNSDGTRTTYQFDQAHHQATATTTTPEGKVTGKIRYDIDSAGRFSSGMVYGPDEKVLYKAVYKYMPEGRLDQEIHLKMDDTFINKIVYHYDASGRQTGYVVLDSAGRIIAQTAPAQVKPSPKPKRKR